MRKALLVACLSLFALQPGLGGQMTPVVQKTQRDDWPAYGRDAGGLRHSPLTQITPGNVGRLQRAWVYHTGEVVPRLEVTPVMVNNVLYFPTPSQRVIALDATTGSEIWTFTPNPKVADPMYNRGVSYWPGDGTTGPRILLTTSDSRLIAIDAKTGELAEGFGKNGTVNLREGVAEKYPDVSLATTSPPASYKNLIILGHETSPESAAKGPPGRSAGVRCQNRQAGLALPSGAASRRARQRDLGPTRRMDRPRRA